MNKNDSRRKLLKSIAAGGGAVVAGKSLPESWSKPVVDAVMLPVHAATTDDTGSDPTETTAAPTTTQGCCLIDQYYCAPINGEIQAYIDIHVTVNGDVSVTVYADGDDIVTDTIPCTGGSFNAGGFGHTVTGTVGCAATSVSGQASIFGAPPVAYEATLNKCGGGG